MVWKFNIHTEDVIQMLFLYRPYKLHNYPMELICIDIIFDQMTMLVWALHHADVSLVVTKTNLLCNFHNIGPLDDKGASLVRVIWENNPTYQAKPGLNFDMDTKLHAIFCLFSAVYIYPNATLYNTVIPMWII